jgi:hypothetical protein
MAQIDARARALGQGIIHPIRQILSPTVTGVFLRWTPGLKIGPESQSFGTKSCLVAQEPERTIPRRDQERSLCPYGFHTITGEPFFSWPFPPAAVGSKFDEKKIDWEVVGVVLFIFTLFPFVWFYRELIQQTYEIRRNHGKDR